MIPLFRNLPLSIRLIITGIMFSFNVLLFPWVGLMMILPFYGMDKATSIFTGQFANETDKYVFLFAQVISSLGTFGFTALLISQLETGLVAKRLALQVKPAFKVIIIALTGVLAAQAFIQLLVQVNQKIPLPDSFKFLAEQGKQSEEIMNALLLKNSPLLFLANTIALAIAPAIGEEFFFRGLVLGDLLKSKINPAFSIVVTGLLFSIAHMEYENLLAIWVLGSFLGYLYYISGSIWLSVMAHFTNNFLLILLKYLYSTGVIKADIAEADIPLYAVIVSTAVFIVCIFMLNKWRRPVDFTVELSGPGLTNEEEEYI